MWGTIFLVVVVFLILIFVVSKRDAAKRQRAKDKLQKSIGIFDEPAVDALAELESIKKPTSDDSFMRGSIVQHNILQNDWSNATNQQVTQIARDYKHALIDWDNTENPAFMLNRIQDANREMQNIAFDDDYILRAIMDLDDVVNTQTNVIQGSAIEKRLDDAIAKSATRAEAVDRYLESSQAYTNDAQNVHDKSVNRDLNATLRELRSTMPTGYTSTRAINEARQYCNGPYRREYGDGKADRAQRCLDIIAIGGGISTFDDTEDNIFAATWSRCDIRQNKRNKKNMCDGIMHALADSIEGVNPVCMNGRCARVLGSLVTLDYDTEVGSAMTFEAYRNQIFQETAQLIKEEVQSAKNSKDDDLREAGEAFDSAEPSTERGDAMLKENILRSVKNNIITYSNKLSHEELASIQRECLAYAVV